MIIDGREVPAESRIKADVCIIGGGPAGLATAMRLARNTRTQVCLLETGGHDFDAAYQDLNRGHVSGTPYFPLESTRIRALGGTTWSWGGVCGPLDPSAFESRPWVSDVGWPFPREDLDVYFDEALAFCGIPSEARAEADRHFAARQSAGPLDPSVVCPTQVYFGRSSRLGAAFREQLAESTNVRVYLNSTAVKIVTGESDRHVTHVVVRRLDGSVFTASAGCYVLAAGGIETPRLLLASFADSPKWSDGGLKLVGRYFMEHPRWVNRFRIRSGESDLSRLVGPLPKASIGFARFSLAPAVERQKQLLGHHANLWFGYSGNGTREWNAIRHLVSLVRWSEVPYWYPEGEPSRFRTDDVAAIVRHPARALRTAIAAYFQPSSLRTHLYTVSCVEQRPEWTNYVELDTERDALGMPQVRVHWHVGDAECQTHRTSLDLILGQLEKLEPGLADSEVEAGEPWTPNLIGGWHHMGTTRMSDDPRKGVVDRDCKLHALEDVYVAGSSVFPTSGTASPTLTIVQLAFRLADRLDRILSQRTPSLSPGG